MQLKLIPYVFHYKNKYVFSKFITSASYCKKKGVNIFLFWLEKQYIHLHLPEFMAQWF